MAFTGSATILENLLVAEMTALLPAGSDPAAQAQLRQSARAMARAIEAWILQAGANSIVASVAPGIPCATAGSPSAQTGATTSFGQIATSSLI